MAKRKGLFAKVARRPAHRPDKARPHAKAGDVPGPSTNPATNFVLVDIAIRAGSYLARRGVERSLLTTRYGKNTAREIVASKTLGQTLLSLALARLATRSIPGAVVVGGAAAAKALLDRRKLRRHAQAEGDRQLLDQASDS